jgi:hypothetical protein
MAKKTTTKQEVIFDRISANDFKPTTFIFCKETESNYFDCYKQYVCSKCGAIDLVNATRGGVHEPVILPKKMPDIHSTFDHRSYIVSEKMKEAIESFSREPLADFYDIPNHDGYFVLFPKYLIYPPKKVPFVPLEQRLSSKCGFRLAEEKNECKKCKNRPDICITTECLTVPDDVIFAAYLLDNRAFVMVGRREFTDHLRKAELKGLWIYKNNFANGKKGK